MMAVGSAVQKGSTIFIYDEQGRQTGAIFMGVTKPPDGLLGYTGSSVSVRSGPTIFIYNERGQQIGSVFSPTH